MPWRREGQPTPVSLPGESQGQSSLVGYSLKGRTELEQLSDLAYTRTPSSKPYETKISIPSLQTKKLNCLDVKSLAQGHQC